MRSEIVALAYGCLSSRLKWVAAESLALLAFSESGVARAAPIDSQSRVAQRDVGRSPAKGEVHSYRLGMTVTYAIPLSLSWAAVITGFATDSNAVFVAFYPEFATLIAPPIVHWANGNLGGGFISLGGNLAFSGLGFFSGGLNADCDNDATEDDNGGGSFCALAGAATGIAIAQTLWAVIDVNESEYVRRSQRASVFVAPRFTLSSGRAGLGLQGAF